MADMTQQGSDHLRTHRVTPVVVLAALSFFTPFLPLALVFIVVAAILAWRWDEVPSWVTAVLIVYAVLTLFETVSWLLMFHVTGASHGPVTVPTPPHG